MAAEKRSRAKPGQPRLGGGDFAAAARQAKKLLRPVRDEAIALLQTLVRTDSVAVPPHGNELAAQRTLARAMRAARVATETYDTEFVKESKHPYVRRDRDYANRPNVASRVTGTGGGRSLLLSGHMDTVPAPGEWKDGSFSGVIRRGLLYGRGAWDMKGGLVAQFAVLQALVQGGVRLRGDVLAESVVDEEWAGGGGTLAARLRGDTADACVIAEGTNLSVMRATRGGAFFEITARAGEPSKYFSKDEVLSPAMPMGRLLGWIEGWKDRRKQIDRGDTYAEFGDPAPVQVLALEGNRFDPDVPWSVPLVAKVRVYFQFLPHEDVAEVMEEVKRSLDAFAAADPFFSVYPPEWHDIVLAALVRPRTPARPPVDRRARLRRDGRPRPRGADLRRGVPM